MIRNIIFDLGNVLISFRPAEYLEKNNYPEKIRNTILKDIFGSREWLLLDNGNITTGEAIDSITKKSELKKEEIAFIFNKRTEIMFPLEYNVRMLPGLKKQGYKLYYLSNFPSDIFEEIKTSYYFFGHFEGGIISSDIKHSKPDPEIYRILLSKYNMQVSECLYIDDIESNIKAAETIGMKVLFTAGSTDISHNLQIFLEAK